LPNFSELKLNTYDYKPPSKPNKPFTKSYGKRQPATPRTNTTTPQNPTNKPPTQTITTTTTTQKPQNQQNPSNSKIIKIKKNGPPSIPEILAKDIEIATKKIRKTIQYFTTGVKLASDVSVSDEGTLNFHNRRGNYVKIDLNHFTKNPPKGVKVKIEETFRSYIIISPNGKKIKVPKSKLKKRPI